MLIGDRLRALRKQKNLSQGHIEKRTGLLRCYVSRVENGHTVPSVSTLEKWARALDIPLYQIFYEGENPPAPPQPIKERPFVGLQSSGRPVSDADAASPEPYQRERPAVCCWRWPASWQ
jgi:transcriptional regulator with XRE-family HTH domain